MKKIALNEEDEHMNSALLTVGLGETMELDVSGSDVIVRLVDERCANSAHNGS